MSGVCCLPRLSCLLLFRLILWMCMIEAGLLSLCSSATDRSLRTSARNCRMSVRYFRPTAAFFRPISFLSMF